MLAAILFVLIYLCVMGVQKFVDMRTERLHAAAKGQEAWEAFKQEYTQYVAQKAEERRRYARRGHPYYEGSYMRMGEQRMFITVPKGPEPVVLPYLSIVQ